MHTKVAVIHTTDAMRRTLPKDPGTAMTYAIDDRPTWSWTLRRPYLALLLDSTTGQERLVAVALVVPGKMASDVERRVTVEDYEYLDPPVALASIKSCLSPIHESALDPGPLNSAPAAEALVSAVIAAAPHAREAIENFRARLDIAVPDEPVADLRAQEKDAIGVLCEAFLGERDMLREINGFSPDRPLVEEMPEGWPILQGAGLAPQDREAFLDLPDEHRMINHDWLHFRDWTGQDTPIVGARTYRNKSGREILIYNANCGPAETALGVDLMYFDQQFGCFIMVQYKKYKQDGGGLIYRPDERLQGQLERMRALDQLCPPGVVPDHLRLVHTPCFFKICEPHHFEAGSIDMIKGSYLARDHFESILGSDAAVGPRKGRAIRKNTLPRHLNHTLFTQLLAQGWIGSCGVGTELVQAQVRQSLETRGAVVLGVR